MHLNFHFPFSVGSLWSFTNWAGHFYEKCEARNKDSIFILCSCDPSMPPREVVWVCPFFLSHFRAIPSLIRLCPHWGVLNFHSEEVEPLMRCSSLCGSHSVLISYLQVGRCPLEGKDWGSTKEKSTHSNWRSFVKPTECSMRFSPIWLRRFYQVVIVYIVPAKHGSR